MRLDLSLFEPLHGAKPFKLIAAHPTEPFVALQMAFSVFEKIADPSLRDISIAIWHSETYELVSVLAKVEAVAWNVDGSELGLIRKSLDYDPDERVSVVKYTWNHLSWPSQELLSSCDLPFVTNWPETIVFSPLGDLAVIQWFEEDKSGLEFISLTDRENPLVDIGLPPLAREVDDFEDEEDLRFFVDTNLTTFPVFSPDGRYIVFGWQRRQHWWTDVPDDVYVEGDLPAKIGECHMGYVQIIDGEENETHMLAIFVSLPPDWQPSYEDDRSNELLSDPVFIDNEHFQLLLPTGEIRVYNVQDGK